MAMVEAVQFVVLGAVRIRIGGSAGPAGPPQQQATLAALLLRSGHAASLGELVRAVWGEDPPDSAVASLRTYVWRLRQRLETGPVPRLLVSAGDGYRLTVPPSAVDANRAEERADAAARAHRQGRHEECSGILDEAVALWQGVPLAGVPGPFAEHERHRLAELRLNLLEERFAHDLLLSRHAQAIPGLTAFTREYPLRERPYGFLMRALYASGRQADALAAFSWARQVLAAELGVDPGPELRALHERILANDPGLMAPEPAPAALSPTHPIPPPPSRPAQLPPDTADFTGRIGTVDELCEALTAGDRATLTVAAISGMGGIGKSTLALRVAHRVKGRFPDGQLYADLRGTGPDPADPGGVLGCFLSALGVPDAKLPDGLEDRSRLLRTVLDGRRVLLLLDDARDVAQIRPLLPGTADCAVVITSRARLAGLPTSVDVGLHAFSTEEALALLGRVIGALRASQEHSAAVELVTSCARLPLAVRIVAARLATRPGWTVAFLAGRLADERRYLTELRAGDLAVAAAFEVGYRQLPAEEAAVFRRLAPVARPGIGLGAAAAALQLPEDEAETLLESLVDAALLESPRPGRYRYHALVQAFAQQLPEAVAARIRDEGDGRDARGAPGLPVAHRLLNYLLGAAGSAFQQMVPGDPVHNTLSPGDPRAPRFTDLAAARAWVTDEFDGAVHALQFAVRDPAAVPPALLDTAADLLVAFSPFGRDIPYLRLAAAARAVAEAAGARGCDRAAGRAGFVCGNAALQVTQLAEARRHNQLAAEACRRAGDTVILRQTFNDLGVIAQFERRYDDAAHCFDQALSLARELGHRSGELATLLNAAMTRLCSGRADEAVHACDEALASLREVADQHGAAHALRVRGLALHALERYPDALASFQECLELCEAGHMPGQAAQARYSRADTLRALGRFEPALREAERALAHFRRTAGTDRDRGNALLVLARVSLGIGRRDEALAQAREALTVFSGIRLPDAAEAAALIAELAAVDRTA
ncbi:AfsR/SARP family transcriptional regulator [Streptomyces sp. NPDC050485]|uniref:AfsR/SARP family transcriptional regulator n=1 Tax=Streptomyces sp. NPDC050485 TaxID=3365617 RepID=UPI0037A3C5B7